MIRTAILSFWHVHATDYIHQVNEHPDLKLVAAWDDDPQRGRAMAAQVGVSFVEDLDTLLARSDIDAVLVQAPTSMHYDIITRAAKAGKHIFSDKVLAPTIKEAIEIVAAADNADVTLVVGMPQLYYDFTVRIKEILESGQLGTLINARLMNAHGMLTEGRLPESFVTAKDACGGALMDMCHIVYLLPVFFGEMPKSVFSSFAYYTGRDVEDSAVSVFEFENGAHATLEATLLTPGTPRLEIELNGVKGTVCFRADSHPSVNGAPRDSMFRIRLGDAEVFDKLEVGRPDLSPIELWAKHVQAGTRPDENIARALDLSRLVEAAYLSADQGARVALSSL